jgi:hypothetical protein
MASPKPVAVRGIFLWLSCLCAGALLCATPVSAQRRAAVMSLPAPSRTVVRMVPAAQPLRTVSSGPVNRRVERPRPQARPGERNLADRRGAGYGCYGTSALQLLDPVPPYGFNYQYLNSINSDLAIKAAIDPATQLALNQARRYGCAGYGSGGYVLWGGGGYLPEEVEQQEPEDSGPAPEPQVIIVQVPAAAAAQPAAEATTEDETPLPDQGQFVLVERDGTQLQAAAFTRSDNTIVYITPEGLRRTIMLSDLDTDATIRVNGERGTQLQLSL